MRNLRFLIVISSGIILADAGNELFDSSKSILIQQAEQISQHLIDLDVDTFMTKITESFGFMCNRLYGADKAAYQSLFNVVIGISNHKVTTAHMDGNLWVKADKANILLEFQVNGTAEGALERTKKYRGVFCNDGKDVLCVGINYEYISAKAASASDRVSCTWARKMYFENDTLKEEFPVEGMVLQCK